MNNNLSKTMLEVLKTLEEHRKLIRWKYGFWTYESAKSKYDRILELEKYSVPEWNCDVKTLRALQKRGLVMLDEAKEICFII